MPYTVGATISASSFNRLASQTNVVYGGSEAPSFVVATVGYGQSSVHQVVSGDEVAASAWLEMRNNINSAIVHQGTSPVGAAVPPVTDFEVGDLIIAYDGSSGRWDLQPTVSAAFTNSLNIDAGQSTITTDALVSSRGTSWSTQLKHIFTVTFDTELNARFFFNSGGLIQIRASRAGGAGTPQNADWTALLAAAGTYDFAASSYFNGAATTNVQRFTQVGASAYAANDWTIFEKRDAINTGLGTQGRIITFEVQFNDDSGGFTDDVNGSIGNVIDVRHSTGAFSTSSKFDSGTGLVTTTALTAGA